MKRTPMKLHATSLTMATRMTLLMAGVVVLFSGFFMAAVSYLFHVIEVGETDLPEDFQTARQLMYLILGFLAVSVVVGTYFWSLGLSRRLASVARKMFVETNELSGGLTQVATSGVELAESATAQASALQQTAAAIDQVSAMAKKSARTALFQRHAAANADTRARARTRRQSRR